MVADLASACALAGRHDEAVAIRDQLLETRRAHSLPAICLARIYSREGDTAFAIDRLETAFAERNGEMVFLAGKIAGAAAGDPLRLLADEWSASTARARPLGAGAGSVRQRARCYGIAGIPDC